MPTFFFTPPTPQQFIRIYTDRSREQEQKQHLASLIKWFLALDKDRKKLFIQVLTDEDVQRTDIVRQLQLASINQKVYTANSHIQMKRELVTDWVNSKRLAAEEDVSLMEQERMDMEEEELEVKDQFTNTWQAALFRRLLMTRYSKTALSQEYEYEEIKTAQHMDQAIGFAAERSAVPPPLEKRFLRPSLLQQKTELDALKLPRKSYMHPTANPYRYPFLDESQFTKQSLNLTQFARGGSASLSTSSESLSRGTVVESLLGEFENSYVADGEHIEADIDLGLQTEMAEALASIGSGMVSEHTVAREEQFGQNEDEDPVVAQFVATSNAYHNYPNLHEHVLRVSRNVILKTGGRTESYSAIVLLGCEGFCGVGFGQANAPNTATEKAKKIALRNMRSYRPDPEGFQHTRVDGSFKCCKVTLTRNKKPTQNGHPILRMICHYLGIKNITIKVNGSRNVLNVIPAFFNTLDKVGTVESLSMATGQMPIHLRRRTIDYREGLRADRRQAFGFELK